IDGLFRSRLGRSSDSNVNVASQLAPTPMSPPVHVESSGLDSALLMQLAKSGILLGLLCILFTRGCDTIDQAKISGLIGTREISEHEFESRWASELLPLEQRVETLKGIEFASNDDKKQLQ